MTNPNHGTFSKINVPSSSKTVNILENNNHHHHHHHKKLGNFIRFKQTKKEMKIKCTV